LGDREAVVDYTESAEEENGVEKTDSIASVSMEPAVFVHCRKKAEAEAEGMACNRMAEIFLASDGTCIVRQMSSVPV
jgi:hypothetical protein